MSALRFVIFVLLVCGLFQIHALGEDDPEGVGNNAARFMTGFLAGVIEAMNEDSSDSEDEAISNPSQTSLGPVNTSPPLMRQGGQARLQGVPPPYAVQDPVQGASGSQSFVLVLQQAEHQEQEQQAVRATQPSPLRLIADNPDDQAFSHCPTCVCCPCCVVYGGCLGCCFTYAKTKREGLKWYTPCDSLMHMISFSCFGISVSLYPITVATSIFYDQPDNPMRGLFAKEERKQGSILVAQQFCLYPEYDE